MSVVFSILYQHVIIKYPWDRLPQLVIQHFSAVILKSVCVSYISVHYSHYAPIAGVLHLAKLVQHTMQVILGLQEDSPC